MRGRCSFAALATLLFATLLCAASIFALGSKDEQKESEKKTVEATGVVRLTGNSPFTEVVITGEDKQWHIARDDAQILYDLQHRTVTVEGEETAADLVFASGQPAGTRYYLQNIKIIKIE